MTFTLFGVGPIDLTYQLTIAWTGTAAPYFPKLFLVARYKLDQFSSCQCPVTIVIINHSLARKMTSFQNIKWFMPWPIIKLPLEALPSCKHSTGDFFREGQSPKYRMDRKRGNCRDFRDFWQLMSKH